MNGLKKAIIGGTWWVGVIRAVSLALVAASASGDINLPGWLMTLLGIIAGGLQAGEPNKD